MILCFQRQEYLAKRLVASLGKKGLSISFAESCTGGLCSAMITAIPGSSLIFPGAIVSYANTAKMKLLGVNEDTLNNHGAVSSETVLEMANGARELFSTEISVAISGVAGPGGGSQEKPVGTVYTAFNIKGKQFYKKLELKGSRKKIRMKTCTFVFKTLLDTLEVEG